MAWGPAFAFKITFIDANHWPLVDGNLGPLPPGRTSDFIKISTTDWHAFSPGNIVALDPNVNIESTGSSSVLWNNYRQKHFFVPYDCTLVNENDEHQPEYRWRTPCFEDSQFDGNVDRDADQPVFWRIGYQGAFQIDQKSPGRHFDEFLHPSYFQNDNLRTGQAHFVGRMSLILGLLAHVPKEREHVIRYINQSFYTGDRNPHLIPTAVTRIVVPEHRAGWPPRGVVVEVGIISEIQNTDVGRQASFDNPQMVIEDFERWASGNYGALISSYPAERLPVVSERGIPAPPPHRSLQQSPPRYARTGPYAGPKGPHFQSTGGTSK